MEMQLEFVRVAGLQLFAEGGAAASGTGAAGSDAGSQNTGAAPSGAQTAQPQTAEETFEDLIKGRYKQDYDARVQKTIQARLKGVKGQAEAYESAKPLIEAVAKRYGVQDTGDITAMLTAFDLDNAALESEALEKGIPVEQYRELKRLELENTRARRQIDQLQRDRQAQEQAGAWMQEAEALKKVFPGLDLAAEIQNPEFGKLLRAGVGVKAAYQVIHGEDITQAAVAAAVKSAKEQVAKSMASGAARPSEGGAGGGTPAVSPKVDVAGMSRDQVRDVMARVARGEKISFG